MAGLRQKGKCCIIRRPNSVYIALGAAVVAPQFRQNELGWFPSHE
jgi:hypothetical protein